MEGEQYLTKDLIVKTLARYLRGGRNKTQKSLNKLKNIIGSLPKIIDIPVNESQTFLTGYFQDITVLRSSIFDSIEVKQLSHLNRRPKIITTNLPPLCSLIHDLNEHSEEALFPQHLRFRSKIHTSNNLYSNLSIWLELFCNICHRFQSWQHSRHEQTKKKLRKVLSQERCELAVAATRICVISQARCQEREYCVQNWREKLKHQIEVGRVFKFFYQVNKSAMMKLKEVRQKLENFKFIMTEEVSCCMLKLFVWPGFSKDSNSPTCLQLYFILRELQGEGPLAVAPLTKSVTKRHREQNMQQRRTKQKIISRSMIAISKSQVCKGAGVFALGKFKKKDNIGEYLGELVKTGMKRTESRLDYLEKIGLSSYCFELDNGVDIDASFYGNYTRLINHMPEGYENCAFIKSGREAFVVATRDIDIGEEILIDYGHTYKQPWKQTFDEEIKRLGGPLTKGQLQKQTTNIINEYARKSLTANLGWKISQNQHYPTIIQLQYI